MRLSHSRAEVVDSCLRKYYYRYRNGIYKEQFIEPLYFGDLVHRFIERVRMGGDIISGLNLIASDLTYQQNYPDESVRIRHAAGGTALAYYQNYEDDVTYHAVEQKFDLQTRGGTRVIGFFDGIVERDGQLYIMEHKTTNQDISKPDAPYWQRLAMDRQITLYLWAAKQLGLDVSGVMYDVIRKPNIDYKLTPNLDKDGLKIVIDADGERVMTKAGTPRQTASDKDGYVVQKTPETPWQLLWRVFEEMYCSPGWYFKRKIITRPDAQVADIERELDHYSGLEDLCVRNDYWPKNVQSCHIGKSMQCEYLPLCFSNYRPEVDPLPPEFVKMEK